MTIAAHDLPAIPTESFRHRAVTVPSFPASDDYEAKESAYLRCLLVDPLRELVDGTDPDARAIADGALAYGSVEAFGDLVRLENALEEIASIATDARAREIAIDALALYRGR